MTPFIVGFFFIIGIFAFVYNLGFALCTLLRENLDASDCWFIGAVSSAVLALGCYLAYAIGCVFMGIK